MEVEDKAEPIKNELATGANERVKQQQQETMRLVSQNPVASSINSQWSILNPQFSQTKQFPFSGGTKAGEFWKSNVANESQDLFKTLMPRKVVISIMNQLNTQMKLKYGGQQNEREIRKKFYKLEQLYQYFGVKILMGYCRMPDPEDYFNEKLPFRNKISELIKESRFKVVETWTDFSDDLLQNGKQQQQPLANSTTVIPHLMKKVNKLQRLGCNAGQNLCVIRNTFFDSKDPKTNEEIYCLLLIDGKTQFILQMSFTLASDVSGCVMRMLEGYKNKNHRVYLQRGLLTLDQVHYLATQCSTYACGILIRSENDNKIKFNGDLITNGSVMLLRLRAQDGSLNILASTADGFHRNQPTDKRSYATVQLQDIIKRSEEYIYLSDQYRCQFSCVNLQSCLMTEVFELAIWNSYIAFKDILRIDTTIEFLNFRLQLAKQLVASKLKNIPQSIVQLPLHHPKTNTLGINTDITGNFGNKQKEAIPQSNFHIPTVLIAPQILHGQLNCLVCRKSTVQLTQCKSCSEVSGKLVSLCASECFSTFHISPTDFISGAEDIPVINTQKQFEQSTMAQSAQYQQSYNRQQQQQQQTRTNYSSNLMQPEEAFNQVQTDIWEDKDTHRRAGRPKAAATKNRAALFRQQDELAGSLFD